METLDGLDNAVLTNEMSKGNDKAAKQYNIVFKYKHPEVDQDWLEGTHIFPIFVQRKMIRFLANCHVLKEENYDQRADLIIKAFKFWQKCWAEELNERPTEEKATVKGKFTQ